MPSHFFVEMTVVANSPFSELEPESEEVSVVPIRTGEKSV
mgnify:CR=1 FL=1